MPKSLADQIRDYENTRAAKAARMQEVMQKSMDAGRSMDQSEVEEFDELAAEIKQIDDDLVRARQMEKLMSQTAQPPVVDRKGVDQSAQGRKGPTILVKKTDPDEKFQGQNYTRMVIAKAVGHLTQRSAIAIAMERWGKTNPHLVEVIKADVAGGGSGSGEWGAELVSQDTWTGDFIDYLYGMTVFDKLGLREVPANVTIKGQDGAATAYWVGESKPIPVSTMDFNDVTLTRKKVAALAVISKELMMDSSPSAEMLIRDNLAQAGAQKLDSTFFSAAAGTATTPAGILYNIPGTQSAGTDGDGVANDMKELMHRFTVAKNSGGQVLVMNPSQATGLSWLRNALDQYEFPNISESGGNIRGKPVFTGDNINAAHVIMLKPSDIYRIGRGPVEISVSDQAAIEMADNPANASDAPTAATGKMVSMYQTESVAIKMVQQTNFARRRESAVAWIKDADYGGAIST